MPKQYEAMRDKFAKGAKSGPAYNKAQSKAAAIYNSKNPGNPVVGKKKAKKKAKGKARSGDKGLMDAMVKQSGSGY